MSVLFVSYTGLLEPLGQSQVLPYVRGLAHRGHPMEILSYERQAPASDVDSLRRKLTEEGIGWTALRYLKHPAVLSTMADVLRGSAFLWRAARRGVRLVHARSHVPALMADLARSLTGVPYLFDHRGLMAEEYADAGIWKRSSWLYRLTGAYERRFIKRARRIVVLTERYRGDLGDDAQRATVIPCAVDLSRYYPASPSAPEPFDLVYAGAWSGLYLAEETLRFFAAYRRLRPDARLLLLVPRGSRAPEVPGLEVRHPRHDEVAGLLRLARAGLSFRRPGPAQRAASPVKVSEYLASGLLVVSSPGVGDLDRLLPATRTGVVVEGFSDEALAGAARGLCALLDETASNRSRRLAEERYCLEAAVDSYHRLYREILGRSEPGGE